MARSRRNLSRGRGTQPLLVEADWSKGMVRDAPRTALPENAVYDSADFLLHQPGLIQKRGGTTYAGPAMTGSTYAAAVAYAEFPSGSKLVGVGNDGHLFTITAATTTDVSTMGATYVPVDTPKLRVDKLIITGNDGLTPPKKYDGSAVAILGDDTTLNGSHVLPLATITVASTTGFATSGTIWIKDQEITYTGVTATTFTGCTGGTGTMATGTVVSDVPPFKYAAIYKTRLVGAGVSGFTNRLYFSPTPDIEETWDSANSWIDADYAVTGLAALHNALLIFSEGHTERIIGSTPPPGTDMDRAPVGSVGCTDARSIVVQEGNALFANPRGVYLTNGAGFASLTTEGAIEAYWQGLFAGYSRATWTIAAGVFRSFYVVSIMNGSTLVATLMCNVPRRAWWRLTNVKGVMMASAVGVSEELYYADRATNRVTALSTIFSPSATVKNDADGTAVTPSLEMKLLGTGPGLKHFGFGQLSYDMRDAATDNPTLAVTVAPGLEATTFGAVAESPLAEVSDNTRRRFVVAQVSQGVTVKLAQTNASSLTEIRALEVEQRPLPAMAGGQ